MIKKLYIVLIILAYSLLWNSFGIISPAFGKNNKAHIIAVHKVSKNVYRSIDEFHDSFDKYNIDIDQQDKDGNTLLLKATQAGNVELVKYLLDDLKANPDIENNNGLTPLVVATSNNWLDITRALLDADAYLSDIDLDREGMTNELKELLREYGAW